MSLRRAVGSVRELSSTSRVWAYAAYAETSRGDPGPNASKFRKSQKKALRDEKSTTAVGGLDTLNGLLDPAPRPPRVRTARFEKPREDRSRIRERGSGRYENAVKTSSPPDAFRTSIKLREITKSRPAPMSTADLDKAIKLVMDAPRSTVSTPVWNMLLGTIGREGRLELMWKTFNDVSLSVHSLGFC